MKQYAVSMPGNTTPNSLQELIQDGIDGVRDIILANRQHFEERVVLSNLDLALPNIREDIGMPFGSFATEQEANLWRSSALLDIEESARRSAKLKEWAFIIQNELRLTDNYQDAIRWYILTGRILHIQANTSVEVDFSERAAKVVYHDEEKIHEGHYTKALAKYFSERLYGFRLISRRKRNSKKFEDAMKILRASKAKEMSSYTDAVISEKILPVSEGKTNWKDAWKRTNALAKRIKVIRHRAKQDR